MGFPQSIVANSVVGLGVTVSPKGIANGMSSVDNNGARFGPDTPGTTTSGIQEAFNSLPTFILVSGSGNFTASTGEILLLDGVFVITTTITIPPGTIHFHGNRSVWLLPENFIKPTDYYGGAMIVNNTSAVNAISCPVASDGFPSTHLVMTDFDVRQVSPGASNNVDIISIPGMTTGYIARITSAEVKTTGGLGNNLGSMLTIEGAGNVDDAIVELCQTAGGTTGITVGRAHTTLRNCLAGNATTAFLLFQQPENQWEQLHAYQSTTGLAFAPYANDGYNFSTPVTIESMHFESLVHYIETLFNNFKSGLLRINKPVWNSGQNPLADINGQLTANGMSYSLSNPSGANGCAIITSNELDVTGYGTNRHVTVPPTSFNAGASPYTLPAYPFDVTVVITTVNGLSAMTLDSTAVAITVGSSIRVPSGHTLIMTWAVTAPVIEVIPD